MSKESMITEVIKVQNKTGDIINYTYMVIDVESGDAVLIDPAWDSIPYEVLFSEYGIRNFAVLLTHSHGDHIDLASYFAETYHCEVWMSSIEAEFYDFTCPNLNYFSSRTLEVGNLVVEILPTPGHTKGGVCFLVNNGLFTGDTLFIEGCGICDGYGGDGIEMFFSLKMLKETLPKETQVYPGHSFGKEVGCSFEEVLRHNFYLHFQKQEDFLKYRMRKVQKSPFLFV